MLWTDKRKRKKDSSDDKIERNVDAIPHKTTLRPKGANKYFNLPFQHPSAIIF